MATLGTFEWVPLATDGKPAATSMRGRWIAEAADLIEKQLPAPALDFVLKCSHTFNLLEARGVISVTERTATIGRIRNLARKVAEGWLAEREALGFPLLEGGTLKTAA